MLGVDVEASLGVIATSDLRESATEEDVEPYQPSESLRGIASDVGAAVDVDDDDDDEGTGRRAALLDATRACRSDRLNVPADEAGASLSDIVVAGRLVEEADEADLKVGAGGTYPGGECTECREAVSTEVRICSSQKRLGLP